MTIFEGFFFKKAGTGTSLIEENKIRVRLIGKLEDIQLYLKLLSESEEYSYTEIVIYKD